MVYCDSLSPHWGTQYKNVPIVSRAHRCMVGRPNLTAAAGRPVRTVGESAGGDVTELRARAVCRRVSAQPGGCVSKPGSCGRTVTPGVSRPRREQTTGSFKRVRTRPRPVCGLETLRRSNGHGCDALQRRRAVFEQGHTTLVVSLLGVAQRSRIVSPICVSSARAVSSSGSASMAAKPWIMLS